MRKITRSEIHLHRLAGAGINLLLIGLIALTAGYASAPPAGSETAGSGMVVASSKIAQVVGMQVLVQGGNAMDAAVAVGYTLAVVHPVAGNLGGGGFAIIRTATGEMAGLDFREMAPGKATRDMFLDKKGKPIPRASLDGYRAAGVPGTVAGLSALRDRYGTRPLAALIQPAIRYAENGFTIDGRNVETFRESAPRLGKYASSRKYFLKPGGSPYGMGDVLVQKDLARTLRLIAWQGPGAFYRGEIAELIARDMAAHGGIITRGDLAGYRPRWREPLRGHYRGYDIISMSPPSSGGALLIQMLNILEGYELKRMGHNSAAAVHAMAEAMRYAYADRAAMLGDPDFAPVPVQALISKKYAAAIRSRIDPYKATPSAQIKPGQISLPEGSNTTHYSVVDRWGNAVAVTYTLNDYYGCAAAVDGAGFLLNNEMDDFSIKPGVPNLFGLVGGEANAIAPYKRPLSSMTPTIVLQDNRLFLVLGSPGGSRIITTVLQVILNVVDFGMIFGQAVDAARVHMQWRPDELRIEKNGLAPDVIRQLQVMGYKVVVKNPMGDVNAIFVDPATGLLRGANDPRNEF